MGFFEAIYTDWRVISVGAAVLSVLLSIILIMLSRFFGQPNFEQMAKTELIHAAATVLLVVMIVIIVDFTEPLLAKGDSAPNQFGIRYGLARCLYLSSFRQPCDIPVSFTQNTLIDWMKLYLDTPYNCVQQFMNVLYVLSIPVETVASVYMEIFMSEHASGFGVKWLSERINNAAVSLAFYGYVYYLLIHILNFIKHYSGFFFSIGVVLRAFPPTRGAGAYLMALAFGLYFVLPLSYILVTTTGLPHAQSNILVANVNRVPSSTVTSDSFRYSCILPSISQDRARLYACEGASYARAFEMRSRLIATASALDDMLTFRFNELTRHLISVICIFPLLAFIILMTFVLNMTTLMGGTIPEIGRGLIKLI